jgi:aldose sugar dehydrogenase
MVKRFWLMLMIWMLVATFIRCNQSRHHSENFNQEIIDTIHAGSSVIGVSVVKAGLNVPWEIAWAHDNKIWFTDQDGAVNRMNPVTGNVELLLNIPGYYRKRLALASMVLHPDFKNSPYVFINHLFLKDTLVYTRLIRYTVRESAPVLYDPKVLLEYPGHPGHNGSRMVIAPDGKLMMATGDIFDGKNAQDSGSVSGKILRMNIDGSVPDDNPIKGSFIWSFGFRVPQGLVYAGNGKLYSAEHGDATDDEVNLISKGHNYGYPDVTGYCDSTMEKEYCKKYNVTEPLKAWTPTIAPAGMDYYGSGPIAEWKHSLLLTTLKGQSLRVLKLNKAGDSIISEAILMEKKFGRLRDICVSTDGDIYLSTSNRDWNPPAGFPVAEDDRILRLFVMSNDEVNKYVAKPRAVPPTMAGTDTAGATAYFTYCGSCHKPDGSGVAGSFPALHNAPILFGQKEKLIAKVLYGSTAKNAEQQMPAFSFLKDKELAGILIYIRKNFANNLEVIQENEISAVRMKGN